MAPSRGHPYQVIDSIVSMVKVVMVYLIILRLPRDEVLSHQTGYLRMPFCNPPDKFHRGVTVLIKTA
jgi:hypothetical protein